MTKIYLTNVTPLLNDVAFDAALKKVHSQRYEKVNRIKHRSDKNLSLGAGLLLEYGTEDFSGNRAHCSVELLPNGKPYLKNYPDVHFSISHSGDIALCTLSDFPIGADIQLCTDFKDEICRRYFKKSETDYVAGAKTPEEKRQRFFKIWTLKEAYVKMTGKGLGQFRDFEIDLKDGISVKNSRQIKPLSFFEFDIPDYKCALCICGEESDVKIKNINIFDLLIN